MSKAICLNCKTTIESRWRHEFVTCSCFREKKPRGIFLDGGNSYLRYGGNLKDFKLVEGIKDRRRNKNHEKV